MEENFLNFDLSNRLSKLGFDKKCLGSYRQDYKETWYDPRKGEKTTIGSDKIFFTTSLYGGYNESSHYLCDAPLIQQARNFLREKYNKFPVVFSDGFQWTYDLRWPDLTELDDKYPGAMYPEKEIEREYFDTYQEAELKSIEKIIEIEENNGTVNNL